MATIEPLFVDQEIDDLDQIKSDLTAAFEYHINNPEDMESLKSLYQLLEEHQSYYVGLAVKIEQWVRSANARSLTIDSLRPDHDQISEPLEDYGD